MDASSTPPTGPDLRQGIPDGELRDAPVLGHVDGEPVLLVRDGGHVRAIGAKCTHYGAPLEDGIVAGGEVRCPWHHACFDLATGRARGPAIAPLPCWDVALEGGRLRVGAKRTLPGAELGAPARVVIVGAGAAGVACAEALRDEGHRGEITVVSAEGTDPVDRPNLSKDVLAGTAPEEWAFLGTVGAWGDRKIARIDEAAARIDVRARTVVTASGRELPYDALLLATGAAPVRTKLPGADRPYVHTLRVLADTRAIAAAATARPDAPVVVIGASFLGLEVAASLRARGVRVTVVGPERVPLARVLGDAVGAFVQRVHEAHGVELRLGRSVTSIEADRVTLDDGASLPAAVVVLAVGVAPRTGLAAAAGLAVENGIVVDAELHAGAGVWAAGDVARAPWHGRLARIEHWQVAVRQGQRAARSMLGRPSRPDVPVFWSQHHDVTLAYVGHAETFDAPEVHGDLDARDAHVVYRSGGVVGAVCTIGRDRLALEVEVAMEQQDGTRLEALVR